MGEIVYKAKAAKRYFGFTGDEIMCALAWLIALELIVGELTNRGEPFRIVKGRTSATKLLIDTLREAIGSYLLSVGALPETIDNLIRDDGKCGKWEGPYVANGQLPVDPWGKAFRYSIVDREAGEFWIASDGPDGMPDTGDDISYVGTNQ